MLKDLILFIFYQINPVANCLAGQGEPRQAASERQGARHRTRHNSWGKNNRGHLANSWDAPEP